MFTFNPKSRLVVKTVSGQELGKVAHIEIDTQTGKIKKFLVIGGVFTRVLDQYLLIDWDQVIEWDDGYLIVSDATASVMARQGASVGQVGSIAHLKEGS
ncbi:PRC-barrel domain-containing protein [Patescibacteria group bacterium]|nr:PRC-barrel domain-containing protein [Patescibacteria group bacterium]